MENPHGIRLDTSMVQEYGSANGSYLSCITIANSLSSSFCFHFFGYIDLCPVLFCAIWHFLYSISILEILNILLNMGEFLKKITFLENIKIYKTRKYVLNSSSFSKFLNIFSGIFEFFKFVAIS